MMRKNSDVKTYGRHRNRVITTDVWGSDNERRKNVFSTSSELDSSKHSSIFQVSSSSSERNVSSSSSLFASNKKARQSGKRYVNKENLPATTVTRQKKIGAKRTQQNKIFSESSSDVSNEAGKKTTRRALRDRNKKVDYNDSGNLKKQLRGTTAKRKRAVKSSKNNHSEPKSVNFSEFEEYSLVVLSESPVAENGKSVRNDLIETSTPVAKRTRCQENSWDKIRNSDLSHIETVSSPFSEISYSVCTPASSLPSGFRSSDILSTPSIVSSVALSDQNSNGGSKIEQENVSDSKTKSIVPENAVVQVERLRQSFILKHVSGRRKISKNTNVSSKVISPEDVSVRLQHLANSLTNSHSCGRKPIKYLDGKNIGPIDNSLSLFESPNIVTRNKHKKSGEILSYENVHRKDSISSEESDEESEAVEEEEEENYEIDEGEDCTSGSGEESLEVDDLSAISENEEEIEESDSDNDSVEEEETSNDSEETDGIGDLQNSMKYLDISDSNSKKCNETLYMLNNEYSSDCSSYSNSVNSIKVSGSKDLFSTGDLSSKISLRSAKNISKSDYFTASSSHLSEEEEYISAGEDVDGYCVDGKSNDLLNNHDVSVRDEDSERPGKSCYSLRDKGLLSLQDSFVELLTPSKKKGSIVPLSARTKLLVLCDQSKPVTFLQAVPKQMMSQCKKIGEGVYGEVFRTQSGKNSVALKIIPIEGDFPVNDEPQKKYEEILPEVVIAKELSSLRHSKTSMAANFCEVRSASLVKGKYPSHLLKEWDIYDKKKGSENDRPDMFNDSQLFILFEFADCGKDLDSYEFENMQQAKSVLAQVVYALAVAEECLQFEHRDLHWGNILVKPTNREDITFKLMGRRCSVPSMGVEANIIDFTMSRLTKDNCSVYTDLSNDDTLFEGKGDYQFDIYRKMKEENGNNWERFNPHSNVCWLHYLADKLVYAKKYPSQSSRQERDVLRQFRQFLATILNYQSACEMALDAHFLNS